MAIRSKLREELPLSTRVHELAKELGLKSPELLDRIRKWGLDVKVSALASLDPSTVERIRELMKQPTAGKETRGEGVAEPAAVSAVAQTATAAVAGRGDAHARRDVVGPGPLRQALRRPHEPCHRSPRPHGGAEWRAGPSCIRGAL